MTDVDVVDVLNDATVAGLTDLFRLMAPDFILKKIIFFCSLTLIFTFREMSGVSELKLGIEEAKSGTDNKDEVRKFLNDLDKTWWSTEPYEGTCGNCGRSAKIRPQDSGIRNVLLKLLTIKGFDFIIRMNEAERMLAMIGQQHCDQVHLYVTKSN